MQFSQERLRIICCCREQINAIKKTTTTKKHQRTCWGHAFSPGSSFFSTTAEALLVILVSFWNKSSPGGGRSCRLAAAVCTTGKNEKRGEVGAAVRLLRLVTSWTPVRGSLIPVEFNSGYFINLLPSRFDPGSCLLFLFWCFVTSLQLLQSSDG